MEKHPLSREFRFKFIIENWKVNYWKCEQNFLLSPKSLSFFSICQAQYQYNFRPFVYEYFIRTYMNILYIYIFSISGRRACCGWLNRGKENEDARNPFLNTFRFSHHIYMPIKRETREELLPNKNHVWNIFQIIINIIICTFKIKLLTII